MEYDEFQLPSVRNARGSTAPVDEFTHGRLMRVTNDTYHGVWEERHAHRAEQSARQGTASVRNGGSRRSKKRERSAAAASVPAVAPKGSATPSNLFAP